MRNSSIGQASVTTAKISEALEGTMLHAIRNLVSDDLIERTCQAVGYRFRKRKITPVVTVLHMILSALWPEESFNACWQVLWDTFVSWFPQFHGQSPSRRRVAEARSRLPLALWRSLFGAVAQEGQQRSEGYDRWNGHRVVLTDGTCVSMSTNPALLQAFGRNRGGHGPGRYPLARLVTVGLAHTMMIIDYALGGYRQDENALLASLLGSLQRGDLLLADRHFAAAHFYVRYQRLGLEFLTRSHQRLKVSRIKRMISYNAQDFVGRLHISKLYRRKDPTLPVALVARFLQATLRIRGRRRVVWFVTSLVDPLRYPAAQIVELYSRRWRIETLFREVKITLSADVLRSQTPDGIRKEIAARLTALNVVRTIMLEAAHKDHLVDPLRLSFVHAVRALLSFSPALGHGPLWQVRQIYEALLTEVSHHLNPDRRGRLEPRALCREKKHYPSLAITRAQWRARHHVA